jgi:hypothetical protein
MDPHRATGCHWSHEVGIVGSWFSQLDWAVYHAEGWQQWQEFRSDLVGKPLEMKLRRLYQWNRSHRGVQDLIRVMNYLRSLRGQWSALPNLRDWHNALKHKYNYLRVNGAKAVVGTSTPTDSGTRSPRS